MRWSGLPDLGFGAWGLGAYGLGLRMRVRMFDLRNAYAEHHKLP